MRVVWLVIPNLLYYYSTTFQGDQGMDARQAQLQTELQAATDAFSAAAWSNVRPARPPPRLLWRPTRLLRAVPSGPRTTGPRRAGAEERLRRRSDACPTSQTSLRFDHPDANGWQQML